MVRPGEIDPTNPAYVALRWLVQLFDKSNCRQRHIDMTVLWPAIRAQAVDIAQARQAFKLHCKIDSAWRNISAYEINRITQSLP